MASTDDKTSLVRTFLVALSIVLSAFVLAKSFRYLVSARFDRHEIRVTGAATRRVNSDRAIWSAEISARAETLDAAYRTIASSTSAVQSFLTAQGAKPDEVRILAVRTSEITSTVYQRDTRGEVLSEERRLVGYELTRKVTLTSSDLARVERIAQGVTDLLQQGVTVRSEPVAYLFTGLASLKLELIASATEDAKRRAERVAAAAGARLGSFESGDVGVVQVNAANESSTTWDGVYDRTSPDKDVMVTVRAAFQLE